MITPLLIGLLSFGSPNAIHAQTSHSLSQEPASAVSTFAELEKAYEEAILAHKKARRAAKTSEERSQLRDNHPSKAFLERFENLAKAGDGRGLLWKVDNMRYLGISKSERVKQVPGLFAQVVEGSAKAKWYPSALKQIAGHHSLSITERVNLMKRAPKGEDIPIRNRVATQFHMGATLRSSSEEAEKNMGSQLLKDLAAKYPDSEYALQAKVLLSQIDVSLGAPLPQFSGKDVDGKDLKVADYRGKVIVLDFFGFW